MARLVGGGGWIICGGFDVGLTGYLSEINAIEVEVHQGRLASVVRGQGTEAEMVGIGGWDPCATSVIGLAC